MVRCHVFLNMTSAGKWAVLCRVHGLLGEYTSRAKAAGMLSLHGGKVEAR